LRKNYFYEKDGSKLEVGWTTKNHNGATAPLYAYGPYAELFSGFHENTDLPKIMAKLLDIDHYPRIVE
jgi:alkaline phosphatase